MNMKIASTKFLAAILFSAVAIVPLRAQTDAPAGNGTAGIVAVTDSAPASNAVAVFCCLINNYTAQVLAHGHQRTNVGIISDFQMSGTINIRDTSIVSASRFPRHPRCLLWV